MPNYKRLIGPYATASTCRHFFRNCFINLYARALITIGSSSACACNYYYYDYECGTEPITSRRINLMNISSSHTPLLSSFMASASDYAPPLSSFIGAGAEEKCILRPRPQLRPRFTAVPSGFPDIWKNETCASGVIGKKMLPQHFFTVKCKFDPPLDCFSARVANWVALRALAQFTK